MRLVPIRRPVLFLATLAMAATLCAEEKPQFQYFPISTVPDYPRSPEKHLAALVQRDGKTTINHFCVVGLRYDGGYTAWVYWKENNTITLWDPPADSDDPFTLLYSRRTLHLDKDVVPDEVDISLSNYMVHEEYVKGILGACETVGQKFVIRKQPQRKKQEKK
jgi:hypothetical protein